MHSCYKKIIFTICITYIFSSTFADNENSHIGARSAGLGNASVTLSDIYSTFHNQAGLVHLSCFTAGLYYDSRFLVNELSTKNLAIAFPLKTYTFGISSTYFGYTNYNEMKTGLAVAKKLGNKVASGIQLNYIHNHIQNELYQSATFYTIEGGFIASLSEEITLGCHLYNPVLNRKSNNNNLPTILRLGFSYKFSDNVLFCNELEKNIDYKPVYKTGIEYQTQQKFFLRLGLSTNPLSYSFGFGYKFNRIKLDIAASRHYILGFTPYFSLIYSLKTENL